MNEIMTLLFLLATASWFGAAMVANTIFIPLLTKMTTKEKGVFIGVLFPQFFRLASYLALTTIITGGYLLLTKVNITTLTYSGSGILLFLTLFHLIVERRLRPIALDLRQDNRPEVVKKMYGYLRIIPRFGLVVFITGLLLLFFGN